MPNYSERQIEELLSDFGKELSCADSITASVNERLAHETIASRRRYRAWIIAGTSAVAVCLLVTAISRRSIPVHQDSALAVALAAPSAEVEIDDVKIVQHAACLLDARTVLVGWTYRSPERSVNRSQTSALTPVHHEKYTELPLRFVIDKNDEVHCWSIFVANGDVVPSFDPPTVTIVVSRQQSIDFGASVRSYGPVELRNAMNQTGLTNMAPISSAEIEEAIQRFTTVSGPQT